MNSPLHETLEKAKDDIRKRIDAEIQIWEGNYGVYITKVIYEKTKKMKSCDIKISLTLPGES